MPRWEREKNHQDRLDAREEMLDEIISIVLFGNIHKVGLDSIGHLITWRDVEDEQDVESMTRSHIAATLLDRLGEKEWVEGYWYWHEDVKNWSWEGDREYWYSRK